MNLFFRYLKTVWGLLALIIVLTLIATIFTTARPLAAAGVIEITLETIGYSQTTAEISSTESGEDNIFDLNQAGSIITNLFIDKEKGISIKDSLPSFIMALVGLSFLGGLFKYFGYVVNSFARKLVMREARVELVTKILNMSLEFFDRNKSGEFVSRVVNDAAAFGRGIVSVTHHFFTSSIMILIYFNFLVNTDPRLTIAIIVILLLHYGITILLKKPTKKYETLNFSAQANLTSRLSEMFSNLRLIKSFSSHKFEIEKSSEVIESSNQAEYMQSIVGVAEPQARYILDGVVEALILFIAVLQLFSGALTIEGFLLYIYVARLMLGPLNEISTYYLWVQRIMVAHKRVDEYISLVPKITSGLKEVTEIKTSIQFKDVSFRYESDLVLSNINLNLEINKVIAIVGPSGSGKSTLLDLILRFYEPTSGNIYIDGIKLKDVELDSYRRIFGIVPQDALLINDSIKNNIIYGREVTKKDLNHAIDVSNSHAFINELPNGIETMIGERGVKLSGGQKQRLSIARAIVANPKILIFDEATSSLDSDSELKVQNAIERVLKNKSAFIVAHRLSTIKNADKIIVMHEKGIESIGSHDDLMISSKTYQKLYRTQFDINE